MKSFSFVFFLAWNCVTILFYYSAPENAYDLESSEKLSLSNFQHMHVSNFSSKSLLLVSEFFTESFIA